MSHIEIGITGGIGSGKSIIAHILHTMQYPVYDTDSHAKQLMNTPTLKLQLHQQWGNTIFNNDGSLNRQQLAAIVFNNPTQLTTLNNIVHPAVRHDYAQWVTQQQSHIVFVESAILQQANMVDNLHHIWIVEADRETRIERVIKRNNCTRQEVEARIASQQLTITHPHTHFINNDNNQALLPQIIKLLKELQH